MNDKFTRFSEKYSKGQGQLLYQRYPADLLTTIGACLILKQQMDNDKQKQSSDCLCLLESIEKGRHRGRYSAIATYPLTMLKVQNERVTIATRKIDGQMTEEIKQHQPPISLLKKIVDRSKLDIPEDLPAICCGTFGYMGYECIQWMEKVPIHQNDELKVPDMQFFTAGLTIVFDNLYDDIIISAPVWPQKNVTAKTAYNQALKRIEQTQKILQKQVRPEIRNEKLLKKDSQKISSNAKKDEYFDMVKQARDYIRAGDVFQVVVSQRFMQDFSLSALSYYRALRRINPSPYLFYFQFHDFALAGSSPEILVTLKKRKLCLRPLAGARKRGETAQEDNQLSQELLADPKDCAEHLMLLDLGRNDVGRVAELGSVKVTEQFVIEKYSHVMHIVSNVEGILKQDKTAFDALESAFPAGTLSGAPKIRAMEIIHMLEKSRRGPYSGTAGYFSANGDMDTCIILRTALIKDNKLYIQAGAGIVLDSEPALEYQECLNKAAALHMAAEKSLEMAQS